MWVSVRGCGSVIILIPFHWFVVYYAAFVGWSDDDDDDGIPVVVANVVLLSLTFVVEILFLPVSLVLL